MFRYDLINNRRQGDHSNVVKQLREVYKLSEIKHYKIKFPFKKIAKESRYELGEMLSDGLEHVSKPVVRQLVSGIINKVRFATKTIG